MSTPLSARGVGARPLRRGVLLGLLTVGLWLALGPATPAWAHAYLIDSSPERDSVVQTAPDQVVLTFNEPVQPVAERFLVVAPDGEPLDIGEPQADGAVVTIPLSGADAEGTYLVSFRVISADSHPVGGSIMFSVGRPSEPPELPTGQEAEDPVMKAAMSTVRYLGYAGLVLLVGPVVMFSWLWPPRLPRHGPTQLVWAGMGLIAASTVASIVLQAPYSTGKSLMEISVDDIVDVLGTVFGQANLVRLAALVALAFLLRPLLSGRAVRTDLVLIGVLGVLALATWPAAGHPIASPLPLLSVAMGMVHLAAAAFWVGGLLIMAGFLLRQADRSELGAILPTWSMWAAGAVVALVLAGVVQAVVEVGSLDALLPTTYGRWLLVKVGLVAVVLAVAAYSRALVRRGTAAGRPGPLRAVVAVEAVILALVIAASAVLVQTTPARTEAAAGQSASLFDEFSTTVQTDMYTLQVEIEPGRVGGNTVHLYAFTPEGEPLDVVEEWIATAELPAEGIEPIDIQLLRITDWHVLGEVSMPVAGEWELQVSVRVSEIDQTSVTVIVPLE